MEPKNRNEKEVFQQLKKMIPQLLLSVSIFSFLFSYSSSLLYPASSKSQYYFSADSLHFLSHAVLDKNCLFLICNGLLVFLSKTSGFIRPPDLDDALHKRIGDTLQTALQKYVLEEVAVHDKEDDEKSENSTESTAEEVSIFVAESEEESGEENDTDRLDSNRFWLFDEEDDHDDQQQVYGDHDENEEEEEEEDEEMSTEELNKKIEDFIRRMKEEIIDNEPTPTHKEMVIVN